MLSENEIYSIINDVVTSIKKHDAKKYEYPEFYNGYNRIVAEYEHISWHTDRGVFPTKLFSERSPNQQPEEFIYIKNNYKQVTMPISLDYFNTIKRAFTDGNWDIIFSDEEQKKYFFEEFPLYDSFENFFKEILPVIKTKDPNGCLAVRVSDYDTITNDEGIEIIDDTRRLKPFVKYFSCKQKILFKENKFYLFLSNKKSNVLYGNSIVNEGLIFELYDDINIYYITQIGKKNDYNFEINIYQKHDLGYIPVKELKGIPVVNNDGIEYISPYSYAVDNLDLILLNSANLQAAINNCVYPVRVMVGNECDYRDPITGGICNMGNIVNPLDNSVKTCPSCNGSGLKSRISVLGTVLVRPKSRENPEGEISADAAFKYVSPDISTLDFLIKKINEDELRARHILHIKNNNISTGENIVESLNNNKSMTAFIKPISDEMFSLIEFTLNTMISMRYGDVEKPKYIYPVSFEFMTDNDYLSMLKNANEANVPPIVKLPLIFKYIQTLYSSDELVINVFRLITMADKLLLLSQIEIQAGILNRTISPQEVVLHNSAYQLINQLYIDDKNFFKKDISEQIYMLKELAYELYNENNKKEEGTAISDLISTQIDI